MTTPSNASTARPLGFGFARPPQAAPAAASSAAVASTPRADASRTSEAEALVSAAAAASPSSPLMTELTTAATSTELATPAAVEGTEGIETEPTGEIELVAILRNDGSRGSAIFAGVFGQMDGLQFRVDPMLKQIYLLSLLDGAVPGGSSETVGVLAALPEVTVVPVPVELAAGFKGTLAHLSATRWAELYDQQLRSAPAITRFALENDARLSNEVVARIMSQSGTPFTVQISTPARQVFEEADMESAYLEDDIASQSSLAVEQATVTTTAGGAPFNLDSEGYRALHMAAADRNAGDVVTYNQVNMFAVIAPDATAAERILALIPQDLKRAAAQQVTNVTLNGEPYVLPAPVEAETEEQVQSIDRP